MKLVLSFILALGACTGSETGNGYNDVALEMRAFNDLETLFALDRDGARFDIEAANARVTRIDLYLPDGEPCSERMPPGEVAADHLSCDANERMLHLDGPWMVDLISGAFSPSLDALRIPEGLYTRVTVAIDAADDTPSFFVAGSVAPARERLAWSLSLTREAEADFVADMPFAIDDSVSALSLLLDVRGWFSDLALADCITSGAVPQVDGVYRLELSDKHCADVDKAVRKAIKDAGKVHKK